MPLKSCCPRLRQTVAIASLLCSLGVAPASAATIGGVDLGNLTDYLFVFTDGSADANWQSSSKGYIGDVAVSGGADFRTSGTVPYSGTIFSDGASIGAWQDIVNDNTGAPNNAAASLNQTSLISGLSGDFNNALTQIGGLTATTGFDDADSGDLDGLNTQNGVAEIFVINITSGFSVNSAINITGDASDTFILRWDSSEQVKFQSGGGINPLGGLSASNFVHTAGDINASGGGSNLSGLTDELAATLALNEGEEIDGGGFFTGYWLTTGKTNGETSSLSNAIFVGGWYTDTTKFSMTSGTSGVYVPPTVVPLPAALPLLLSAFLGLFAAKRGRRLKDCA